VPKWLFSDTNPERSLFCKGSIDIIGTEFVIVFSVVPEFFSRRRQGVPAGRAKARSFGWVVVALGGEAR
jgi:hypothetical protein